MGLLEQWDEKNQREMDAQRADPDHAKPPRWFILVAFGPLLVASVFSGIGRAGKAPEGAAAWALFLGVGAAFVLGSLALLYWQAGKSKDEIPAAAQPVRRPERYKGGASDGGFAG